MRETLQVSRGLGGGGIISEAEGCFSLGQLELLSWCLPAAIQGDPLLLFWGKTTSQGFFQPISQWLSVSKSRWQSRDSNLHRWEGQGWECSSWHGSWPANLANGLLEHQRNITWKGEEKWWIHWVCKCESTVPSHVTPLISTTCFGLLMEGSCGCSCRDCDPRGRVCKLNPPVHKAFNS